MTVTVRPSVAHGRVTAPPSKSMAHRLLISAGLSHGESFVSGIADSQDVLATADCLRGLGVSVEKREGGVSVRGCDVRIARPAAPLFCRESGSTLRFLIPIAMLSGEEVTLTAQGGLMSRPLDVYRTLASDHGLTFRQSEGEIRVKGPLTAGDYTVVGNVSSQFISGLLFALPLTDGDSRIRILPPVESRPYINLTLAALSEFGVRAEWQDQNTLFIPGMQEYRAHETAVEGDYSNAAFLEAFNLFGGEVKVDGLKGDSLQGDRAYLDYFKMLDRGTPTIHIGDTPDLAPVLFAVAAAKHGGIFTGTRRLKIKESDRAAAMAAELAKFGTSVTVYEDTVVVYPADFHAPREPLSGHNDHRIVMSLTLLASLVGGEIEGAEAVKKSFPDFFSKIKELGVKLDEADHR